MHDLSKLCSESEFATETYNKIPILTYAQEGNLFRLTDCMIDGEMYRISCSPIHVYNVLETRRGRSSWRMLSNTSKG